MTRAELEEYADMLTNARSQRRSRRPWVLTRRGERLLKALTILGLLTMTWVLWTGFLV